MSNMKRGLAAATAIALLSLTLLPPPGAAAHDSTVARTDKHGRPAKTKNQPAPNWTTWPEGSPDYHGSNGG